MTIEFIGMMQQKLQSEIYPPNPAVFDADFVRDMAVAHDEGGFDRLLIGYYSNGPDGFQLGQQTLAHTKKTGVLIAHRPGFVAPPVAARKFATLDQISQGRVAIHVISGGDDTDQHRDGDWLGKDDRYRRTDEYIGLVKRIWTERQPVDHKGEFYHVEGAQTSVTPYGDSIPVYFGGASAEAIDVAGRHADVYALWGETLDQTRELIERVRASAARYGRTIRFSLSLRPILADTEESAWELASSYLERARAIRAAAAPASHSGTQPEGARRLLEAASRGARLDKRLWTEMASVTGGRSNSTSLVGTPDQVAEAMLDYHDLGVTTFLIRGFDPLKDAIQYGRELIPRVRRLVGERSRT